MDPRPVTPPPTPRTDALPRVEDGDAIRVLSLAKYTIPFHALLPLPILALSTSGHDGWLTAFFMLIHLGFPVALGVTYPLWKGQGAELVILLVINHLVTFAAGLATMVAYAHLA